MFILKYLIIIVAIFFGYFIAKFLSGKTEGAPGKFGSLIFTVNDYTIHLHHWFIATIILIFLIKIKYHNTFILSFLFGIILQGLNYRDFYKIIYKIKKS